MYLKFNDDIPVYSLSVTETNKLNKIIDELDKIKDEDDIDTICIPFLFKDRSTIQMLDFIFQSYYMAGIEVKYPRRLRPYLQNNVLLRIFTRMIFASYYKIAPEANDIISKYKFIYTGLRGKMSILYSPGIVTQFNIIDPNHKVNIFGPNSQPAYNDMTFR